MDVHTLAGAYALDALSEFERAAFARHLAGCEACAAEVAGLTEAAARLAVLDAQAPPARLRDTVLNEVYRTRQLPAERARMAPVRGRAQARSRWLPAVAAAVVGIAGMTGVWAVQQHRVTDARGQTEQAISQQEQVAAILSAPDAQVRGATPTGGGRVTVVVSPSLGDGVVLLAGLPDPSPDRAYQLWLIRDGVPTSAGLLAAGTGSGTVLLDGVHTSDTLGVTQEPSGGSPAPTPPILTDIDLTT
ncbi:MAG TPA: anti-sigma factor [Micromonosporaceae bacterium]